MIDQRVAIVTGSSRGIGRAIAQGLAADGLAVVVNYHSSASAAEEVVSAIRSAGGTATAMQADVGDAAGREKLVAAAIAEFGRLDVLVNNAGITSQGRKDLLAATEASWDAVFATNLKAPFFLAQLAARQMISQQAAGMTTGGRIVNVSSISAYAASTNRADYCIAKAGLEMLTWLFADRLAEHHISVFDICPGVIASDMTAPVKDNYDRLIADGMSPMRRWGTPEDVAQAVSLVVGDKLAFTTGQRIHVDGGFHIRRL